MDSWTEEESHVVVMQCFEMNCAVLGAGLFLKSLSHSNCCSVEVLTRRAEIGAAGRLNYLPNWTAAANTRSVLPIINTEAFLWNVLPDSCSTKIEEPVV